MLGGMAVLRIITAPDMATRAAQAQVHPGVAHLQAFLAPARVLMRSLDGFQVMTAF
jgi:hypothetical protein